MTKIKVYVRDLGLMDYKEAWDFQEVLFKEIVDLKIANREASVPILPKHHLLFCEHPHVFTLGRSGKEEHFLLNEVSLKKLNASFYKINRGGDITYHGPGQLVVYPILDLDQIFTDIHKYLRLLEEAVIATLAEYGINAERSKGETGVWLDINTPNARKICAMGVKTSRWVTMHGIGFNVNTDLSYFNHIIPCGIPDKTVTSMQKELGREIDMEELKSKLLIHISSLFNFEPVMHLT